MLSKTALLFFLVAIIAQLALASPPACLLGAVNEYKDPSDIEAVCKDKDNSAKIAKFCGGSAQVALNAFADLCDDKGVEVSTKLPTTTSSSASGTSTPTGTRTSDLTAASATNSGATSGGTQPTGAAGRVEIGAVSFLAGLGIFVAAL